MAELQRVVEAKREDIIGGLGQCAAAMAGIRVFNEKAKTTTDEVYGCVTSGNVWRFLRLVQAQLTIDRQEYYLPGAAKILGILVRILSGNANAAG